jgi:hypothetical protein
LKIADGQNRVKVDIIVTRYRQDCKAHFRDKVCGAEISLREFATLSHDYLFSLASTWSVPRTKLGRLKYMSAIM